ncbi:MAG: type II secretion system F family protein [Eubacterium sp.]|nr:type II secretion system F family protein [Eubacterium sp.]
MKTERKKKGSLLWFRRLRDRLFRHKATGDYVRMMEPRSRPEQCLSKIWRKRLGLAAFFCVAAIFLWILCFTSEPDQGYLTEGRYIERPDGGEEVELTVQGESGNEMWKKQFRFDIGERDFTEEEKTALEKMVRDEVESHLKGKNESLEHVTGKLDLVEKVPGTGVELSWTYDENLLRDDGTLIRSHIPQDGTDTELMVEAKWRNYKQAWHYPIHIEPPDFSDRELAESAAKKDIRSAIRSQNTEKKIELPEEYRYEEEKEEKNYLPVLFAVGALIALPFVWRTQMKRGIENREEQLLVDHPGFINKVMLLLGAGLTLRYVIERIASEYERELEEGGEKHFVYEELCVTMQEIRDGVTEAQAVENFGRRCRCMPYMRFASLITQNIRKGAEGLLAILEKEATESLIERKQTALRQGEKAGTKLLFPMILMLGLVMSIIMVPAFMTM